MEKKFYIISFNYKNLTLEEREDFIKKGYKDIINKYKLLGEINGYVAVETCLRIELYLDVNKKIDIQKLKKDFKSENIKVYNGMTAIKYLLRVICGFESIIKGEEQILSQLKKSYLTHLDEKKTSTLINIIFNGAIETGKKFRNESKINEKNISLDSIAVKFIKSKFTSLDKKNIFIIGVGELSQSILSILYKKENCNLTMTNRSIHRSIEIVRMFKNIKIVEFSEKYKIIKKSDIIISATAAPHLIIEKDKMKDIVKDGKERFYLDLAVPRDIDKEIGNFDNNTVYHLEDIWDKYTKNMKKRDEIVDKYSYIIEEQLEKIHKKMEKRENIIKNNIEV